MALNEKLKLLYRKNRYLTKSYPECSAMLLFSCILIMCAQPGTRISTKKQKNKIQVIQNKYIRFCLKLDKIHHISENEFRLINWLRTSKRVDRCINTIAYNSVHNTCPYYLNEIFEFSRCCRIGTGNNFSKLNSSSVNPTKWSNTFKQFVG